MKNVMTLIVVKTFDITKSISASSIANTENNMAQTRVIAEVMSHVANKRYFIDFSLTYIGYLMLSFTYNNLSRAMYAMENK